MKQDQIQKLVDRITQQEFIDSDIFALFILLRPTFANLKEAILLDVVNFLAHSEGRNQGASYRCIKKFIEDMKNVSVHGGSFKGPEPIFNRTDIIDKIADVLNKINITFNRIDLSKNTDLIIDYLQSWITESEYKFDIPEVIRCYTNKIDNKMQISLHIQLSEPRITISPETTINLNFFN